MVYSGDNQIVAEIRRLRDISPNETPSSIFLRLYGRIIFLNTKQMITKQQKSEIIDSIKKDVKKSSIVMFANFHGLNVKLTSELRKLLRQVGAKYFVTRKTLVKKALEIIAPAGEMPNLEGEVAIVYTEGEPLPSASALNGFAKKNKFLKILGGIFENQYIGMERLVALASIPSREVLLSQILNIISSPKRGLVVALSEIAKKKQN